MSPLKSAPTLKRHKATGHAYAYFNRRQIWFGSFDEPEAHIQFATYLARWEASGRAPDEALGASEVFVSDLVAQYLVHAEGYYRKPNGSPTHEVVNIKCTVRPLLALFGALPVDQFDIRCLKLVRERLIDSGLCRWTVNDRVTRTVRIFGWGAEEEVVAAGTYGNLRALKPLKRNRSRARESKPVAAVEWRCVEAVLGRVSRQVATMVRLQWHTGMRPGEVLQLRMVDLDRSGEVWIYRPVQHKTLHHGKSRVVPLGPRAQAVLNEFLENRREVMSDESPLFSPSDSMAEFRTEARRNRRTPLWASSMRAQRRRKRTHPKKTPGDCYTASSYRRAITSACKALGMEPWSPNQLRHAAATRIRRVRGIEAARAVLGHSSAAVTEVYAELDERVAVGVMREMG